MTATQALKKAVAVLVSVMMLATLVVLAPVGVGAAAANGQPTEIGREKRTVTNDLRCFANAPVVGATPADQPISVSVTAPTSITPGATTDVLIEADAIEVPTELSIAQILSLGNILVTTLVSAGATVDSVEVVPNTATWTPPGSSTPTTVIPGGAITVTKAVTAQGTEVRLSLPGPYPARGTLQPPAIRAVVTGTGPSGTKITTQLAGAIPASQTTFPWARTALQLVPVVVVPGLINDPTPVATYCAPNYGPGASIPANVTKTVPPLAETLIDSDGPILTVTSPRDSLVYNVDEGLIADFTCTDPSGIVRCDAEEDGVTYLPGDPLPDDKTRDGVLTITAVDGFGFTTTRTIQYKVDGNAKPTVTVDEAVIEAATNQRVTLSGSATDPDAGQVLSYTWIQESGPPVTLDDSDDPFATTNTFTTPSGPVSMVFKLRVDDGVTYGEGTVTVNVGPNLAPVITNGQDQDLTAANRSVVTMDATATDGDGQTLTYTWRQLNAEGGPIADDDPDKVTLSSTDSPIVTFTAPNLNTARNLRFEVDVTDGGAIVVGTVDVAVAANQLPVLQPSVNQTVLTGEGQELDGTSIDPEGNTVTYAWVQVDGEGDPVESDDPLFLELSANDVAKPTADIPQSFGGATLYYRLSVSDGNEVATSFITLAITGNRAPTADAGPDQSPARGVTVTLSGSGTDPDGHAITGYAWTQTSGTPVVTLTGDDTATPTFTSPTVAEPVTLVFSLIVTDEFGLSSATADTVSINLVPSKAPVANAGTAQINRPSGSTVTLDSSGSTDPDAGDTAALTYSWTQVASSDGTGTVPEWQQVTLTGGTTATPSFTAPQVTASTTLYFQVTATDPSSLTDTDIVAVQVNALVPVASASPATGVVDTWVQLSAAVPAGYDEDDFTYTWIQVASAGATTSCAPSCPGTAIELLTSGEHGGLTASARQPVLKMPGRSSNAFYGFRVSLNDGVSGGSAQSATATTLTVTNTAPTVEFSVRPWDLPAQGNSYPQGGTETFNNVWGNVAQTTNAVGTGGHILLDATSNPAITQFTRDLDQDNLTYAWNQFTSNSNTTNCSTTASNVNYCRLRIAANSTAAATTTRTTSTVWFLPQVNTTSFLRLNVSDGVTTVTLRITIRTSTVINAAPTSTIGGTTPTLVRADVGEDYPASVPLQGTATDAQTTNGATPGGGVVAAQVLTYEWVQTTGAASTTPIADDDPLKVTIADPTALNTTFGSPDVEDGTVHFRLIVSDGITSTTSANRSIEFRSNKALPIADAGPDRTNVSPGSTVSLDGTGSTDPQGRIDSYLWQQLDAPGGSVVTSGPDFVAITGATTASASITAPSRTTASTLYFRLTITDGFGATDEDEMSVSVNADLPPTAVASASPASPNAGATVTLSGSASTDPEGRTLTYAWVQTDSAGDPLVSGAVTLTGANTASATFSAPGLDATTPLYFRLTVSDPAGSTDTDSVTVSVQANRAPVANAGAASVAPPGATVTLNGSGSSDPDGNTLTYLWTQTSGTTVSFTASQTNPTFTAPVTAGEVLQFSLVVTDQFGKASTAATTSVALQANNVPVANAGPPQSGFIPGATVTLDGTASTDVDNPTGGFAQIKTDVVYATTTNRTLSGLTNAGGIGATPTAGQRILVRGQTNASQNGIYLASATAWTRATDADTADELARMQVRITSGTSANQTWHLNLQASEITVGTTALSYTNGPASYALTYAWTQESGPAVTLSSATMPTPSFVPTAGGSYLFKLVVTDAFNAVSNPSFVLISVNNNRDPVANAGPDQTDIQPNTLVTLDGSGSSDADGHTITYAWTQTGGTTVTITGGSTASPTFTTPVLAAAETLTFTLTVADGVYGGSATDTVSIGVLANRPPVANAGPDQTDRIVGSTVTLTGAGSSDPDAQAITYAWTQTSGTSVTLSSATAVSPTFTSPAVVANETLVFSLVVTDALGLASVADTVSVGVLANRKPVANAGADQTGVGAGSTVTLNGAGSSDPDNQVLTYAWTQTSGPSVTLSSATVASPTFTAPSSALGASLGFRLVVTDSLGLASDADTVAVTVLANRAPVANAGGVQTVGRGRTVSLNGSGSSDPDGNTITYQWVQVEASGGLTPLPASNPLWVSLSSETAVSPTFTSPTVTEDSELHFALLVTDQFGLASAPAWTTVFLAENRAPVANAGTDQTVPGNLTIQLDGSATSDPDAGDVLTYLWEQVDSQGVPVTEDGVTITNPGSAVASILTPVRNEEVVYYFRLTATDNFDASDSETVSVTVWENAGPLTYRSVEVRIASTANRGLTGLAAIDGVTPVAGDRVLLKNQTTGSQNGIYIASAGTWVRAADYDEPYEIAFTAVAPTAGAQVGRRSYLNLAPSQITVGSTNLAYQTGPSGATTYGDRTAAVAATTGPITTSGLQVIDGVSVNAGDRVLVKDQANPRDNGVYVASAGGWSKATDTDMIGSQSAVFGQVTFPSFLPAEAANMRVGVIGGSQAGSIWSIQLAQSEVSRIGLPVKTDGEESGVSPLLVPGAPLNFTADPSWRITTAPTNPTTRRVNTTVTMTLPEPTNTLDPEGAARANWTYTWFQTDSVDSTEPCGESCGDLAVTVLNPTTRVASFVVPPITNFDSVVYFRVAINDGLGGISTSPAVVVQLADTPATINKQNLIIRAGADVEIADVNGRPELVGGNSRTVISGPAYSTANAVQGVTVDNTVYGGVPTYIDIRDAGVDADDPTAELRGRVQSGMPGVITGGVGLDGDLSNATTSPPNGSCDGGGFALQETDVPGVWFFIPPAESFGPCRLQFQMQSTTGRATAWNTPNACFRITVIIISVDTCGTTPTVIDAQFHTGSITTGALARARNVTNNRDADFWLNVKANTALPVARVAPLPERVFNSPVPLAEGELAPEGRPEETVITLDGSASTDADTSPTQPLRYEWVQLDENGAVVPADDPRALAIADRNAVVTTVPIPSVTKATGAVNYQFRFRVVDGAPIDDEAVRTDVIDTTVVKVTARRPVAGGSMEVTTATVGGDQGTSAYLPNVDGGTVQPGEVIALDADGSVSPDGRNLQYEWKVVAGPDGVFEGAFSPQATFTVGNPESGAEPLVLELAVRDGLSAAYRTFTFTNEFNPSAPEYCPVGTNPYFDVPNNAPYLQAATCLYEEGVVTGRNVQRNGQTVRIVEPANTLTRGGLMLILWRASGEPSAGTPRTILDVPASNAELRTAVTWAFNNQVANPQRVTVNGVVGDGYRPADQATRVQLVQFMHRLAGRPSTTHIPTFTDLNTVSAEARTAVAWAQGVGILPQSGTRFRPTESVLRSDMLDWVWKTGHVINLWVIDPQYNPPAQLPS